MFPTKMILLKATGGIRGTDQYRLGYFNTHKNKAGTGRRTLSLVLEPRAQIYTLEVRPQRACPWRGPVRWVFALQAGAEPTHARPSRTSPWNASACARG